MSDLVVATLTALLPRLPVLLAYLVAIAVAIVRWPRHPRVSLLVVIAMPALATVNVVQVAVAMSLPMWRAEAGWSMRQVGVAMALFSVVTSLFEAACWTLLLFAIFGWRAPPSPR